MADVYWGGTYDTDQHVASADNNFMNANLYMGIAGASTTPVTITADGGTTFLWTADAIFRGPVGVVCWGVFRFHGEVDNPITFREDPTTFPPPVFLTVARCQAMFTSYHEYDWKYIIQRQLSQWGGWIDWIHPRYAYSLTNSLQYRCVANSRVFMGIPQVLEDRNSIAPNLMSHNSHYHVDSADMLNENNTAFAGSAGPCSCEYLWFSRVDCAQWFYFLRINVPGIVDISKIRLKNIYMCPDVELPWVGTIEVRKGGVGTWPPTRFPPVFFKDSILGQGLGSGIHYGYMYLGSLNTQSPSTSYTFYDNCIIYNYATKINTIVPENGGSGKGVYFYKMSCFTAPFVGIRAFLGDSTTQCSGASMNGVYMWGWNRMAYPETTYIGVSNPPYQLNNTSNLSLSNSSDSPIHPLDVQNVVATPATSSVTITFDSASGTFGDRQFGLPVVKYGFASGLYPHRAGQYPRSDLGLINAQVQFDWEGNPRRDLDGIEFKKTGHSITIRGLSPGTTYYFVPMIQSYVDYVGNEDGTEYSFTTLAAAGGAGGRGSNKLVTSRAGDTPVLG